ncbi:unnamed protein product [Durusdinium trenchii]|uniref:Uncharacterized protein n=1 Tax=Durusdinium trenchii TaxID=1381693 RepID=A0ABP0R159_9DINO
MPEHACPSCGEVQAKLLVEQRLIRAQLRQGPRWQAEFVAAWRSFHMLSGSTMIYTWRGAIVFLVRATVSANGQITTVDLNPLSSVAQSEAHQDRRVTDTSGALAGHGDETGRLAKLTRHYGCDTRVQLTKKKIVLSYKYLKRAEKRLNNFYKEYQFKKTSRWNPFGNASCPTGMVPAQETDRCSIDMERLIWVVRTWKEKVSKDKRLAEINVHSNNPLFQDEVERLKKDIAKIKEQYSEMYFHMQEAAKMHRF